MKPFTYVALSAFLAVAPVAAHAQYGNAGVRGTASTGASTTMGSTGANTTGSLGTTSTTGSTGPNTTDSVATPNRNFGTNTKAAGTATYRIAPAGTNLGSSVNAAALIKGKVVGIDRGNRSVSVRSEEGTVTSYNVQDVDSFQGISEGQDVQLYSNTSSSATPR